MTPPLTSSSVTATGARLITATVTRSGWLNRWPSKATSCAVYEPRTSAKKVGSTAVGSDSAAALPAGRVSSVHWYVSTSFSASDEPEPSSCTVSKRNAVWLGPASATGGVLTVVTVTVSGRLASKPSETESVKTYTPKMSGTKVGSTAVGSDSAAVEPEGELVIVHE